MPETLLLCQVGDTPVASPVTAAELYYLGASFGSQTAVGAASPLLIETGDYGIGRGGVMTLKTIYVPFAYSGACQIRVTPIVDLQTSLGPQTRSFPQPARRTEDEIEIDASKRCTWVRVRIEVLDATGLVEIYSPDIAWVHLTGAGKNIVSRDSAA